jgi:PAS domain S-box-containing protein
MLAAGFLPRWAVAALGAACAVLAEVFSALEPSLVRLLFETLALSGCGLFVAELVRNRRVTLSAQEATAKAEERLRALVETSPAAIVTVDDRGLIEMANRAAEELLITRSGKLSGNPVAAFLPELHHALRWEEAPQFRASMQCRAHKGNGETFLADVWFSTYKEGSVPRLAAIIAEVSEDAPIPLHAGTPAEENGVSLQQRETDVLRLLVQGHANKEIAARMEVSESTVKNTLQQLFTKTGVRTRSQLVRVALEEYRRLL